MLSGGERRRVEIARSLAINPKFLLLDEPFSGIDPIQVLELQRIIFDLKRSGIGILMTDHNVRETLMVTDRAYIINNGRIFRVGQAGSAGPRPGGEARLPGREFQLRRRSEPLSATALSSAKSQGSVKRPALRAVFSSFESCGVNRRA